MATGFQSRLDKDRVGTSPPTSTAYSCGELVGLNALIAQALILPVTVVLSYLINARIVFRERA